ncbi:hypothetical protein [Sediminispirochaeta bajacaliforniensis]|nr:hypothetical protein [Sediminispirochaeta bajacaliforniensis]
MISFLILSGKIRTVIDSRYSLDKKGNVVITIDQNLREQEEL